MKIINFFENNLDRISPSVFTVGMFDGVHRGHQNLIKICKRHAHLRDLEVGVLTFVNHPSLFLRDTSPFMIQPFQDRIRFLEKKGVETLVLVDFDNRFSKISPEDFIIKHLMKCFNMKVFVCGMNFRFGYKGKGDVNLLEILSRRNDFVLDNRKLINDDREIISSTLIRKYVSEGKISEANKCLGRSYSIVGNVVSGQRLGRELGFPTANIDMDHSLIPLIGVYGGYNIINEKKYLSLISIGNKPTIHNQSKVYIEVHVIGFSGNLYGSRLETFINHKIRNQIKCEDINHLKEMIQADKDLWILMNKKTSF